MGVEGEFKHPEAPLQTVHGDEVVAWSHMRDKYTSVDYASIRLDEVDAPAPNNDEDGASPPKEAATCGNVTFRRS
jgi:hypothetical protein